MCKLVAVVVYVTRRVRGEREAERGERRDLPLTSTRQAEEGADASIGFHQSTRALSHLLATSIPFRIAFCTISTYCSDISSNPVSPPLSAPSLSAPSRPTSLDSTL